MRVSSFIFSLLSCIGCYAQDSIKFINYSTVNGLADNKVLCITQDSRGFMWFGTSEGLSRFDGNKFENYFADPRTKNSLPDNNITSIDEYKPGHLLLLAGASLCCLNTFTRQFYTPPFATVRNVYSISKAGSSGYVISCTDTGFILNRQLQVIDTLFSPIKNKGQSAFSLYLDKDHILAGRRNEYYVYNRSERKNTLLLSEEDMPARERILTFQYFDSTDQSFYFSNYFGGIYKYDLSGNLLLNWKINAQFLPFHNGNIRFIVPKNDSVLWIGNGEGQGIAILNKHTNRVSLLKVVKNNPSSLASNSVLATYTDNEGNEWIGTSGGISKTNNTSLSIKKFEAGNPGSNSPFLSIKKGSDGNFYAARFGYPHI
jgi:ligand-binding sensor domain-containing protein